MHQASHPHPAQFGSQAAGTAMPEGPAQAVAMPVARLPGPGDPVQPAGALSATPAERKPSPGPVLQMRPALLPGGSNVVSRPSAHPPSAAGGVPASASTSRPGSGAPSASRPELRFAASRREEVLRSDGRQEVRWFLSDPHGTSWLAVAGLKGDQAGAAAPGQAFIAQGSFVTRTPFSSATEAGVEAFLQQILRATGKPLPQQQTGDAAAAPSSTHAARAPPRPASGSQMTAPAGPAGVGPAPAADQVIKPAPTAPEKVPVQVLADINLEKHLQQERDAVELAAREAVIVELQSRAADEAARRATAVKAALQWVRAPVDPSELEYVEIQLQNIKGLLAEYEKQVHPPEPEPEPEQPKGAGQGEEGEAAQAEGGQAGKGGKSLPKKGKRRAKPRPRTKEARSRAKQSMAAAAAAAAAGMAASGAAGPPEAAAVEAASAAPPAAAAAQGKAAAEQAANGEARAAKSGAHMAQASPSVQARGLVDYPSDSDASVDTVRSKGRDKSVPAGEPRRRAPLRTASAAGKARGKGTPAAATPAQPIDLTPPEAAAAQPKLESEAGPKQEPCAEANQVAPPAEGDNERGLAQQQGRQREAAAARLAPAPGKASKLYGMVLSDLLDALRELASTHMSLRIMMATNVMAFVQPLRDHEDWAIRTMARNCTDQWRRSMAAHLGTLAQPRFVQDPLRDADRLLASRAAQLDAALQHPGARGASAAPGERRGKGGSVPRTDVVAALQAAAARTPPPPSQVGMPGMPAAPAPGGAKPNQAAASVSVGSVSANAAVLAPGIGVAKPLPHAPMATEGDTAAAAQEVKTAPAAPGTTLPGLVRQPEAAQPVPEARQPGKEPPVAAATGAVESAEAAPGPKVHENSPRGGVQGMAGLMPVAALPNLQATQASAKGTVQQQQPEQLARTCLAPGTAAAAATAASPPSQQRPQSPVSNAVGPVMGSAVGQQQRPTAGPQAAGPSPATSRSPASRPGSAQQKGLASPPAAVPMRPSMPAQQVPASMITVPAQLPQTMGSGQASVTPQQLWAQQGQFGQRTGAPHLAKHFRPGPLQQPRPGLAGAAAGQPQRAAAASPASQAGRPQTGGTSRPGSAGALGQPTAKAVVPPPRVIVGKAPSPISSAPPPPTQLPTAQAPADPGALAPILAASKPPAPDSVPPAATSPQAGAAVPPPPQAAAAQAEPAKGASEASRAALPAPASAAAGQAPTREAGAGAAKTAQDRAGILAVFQSLGSESQGNAEEPSKAATDEREESEESGDGGADKGSGDEARAQDDGNDLYASELSDSESVEGQGPSPARTPAEGIRRSNRSRHQPSWTQLSESGTDPSSSGPPARVAVLRSRRRPQALEDQATDSQVEAAGAGTPSRLRTTSARDEDSAAGTDEEGPSGQSEADGEQSPSREGDEADGDEAEQGGSELRRGTRARRKTAAVLEAEAAQRKTVQTRRRRPPRPQATPRARGHTGSGQESEGEQQARESDAQSQSSDASQAEDGPGSVVATPGSDAGSPTGASEAEEDAGSDGDSEAEGATSGEDAAQESAEDTAAAVPAEAAKLRQPVAVPRGGAAAQRPVKSAAGQKRQRGGTTAGHGAQKAAKQQRGPAAAATAAAAAAAAAAASDGGDTDSAPVLKVHRRPRTGGRKRKSMDAAARLSMPPAEPAAAAEPPQKRKRKSAPAAKAAAAGKDEDPQPSSRKAASKRAGAAVVTSAAKKGKAAQPRSATPAGSDAEAAIPDEESWDKALLRKLQTAPPGADAPDMAPAAQALCYLEWFGKPLKSSRFIQIGPLVTSANKGVFLRLRRDPDWRDNSRGAKKVATASKHVQDAAAKIRQGRPFHANNKSKQALLNAFDRLIAMVAELVSNE